MVVETRFWQNCGDLLEGNVLAESFRGEFFMEQKMWEGEKDG